MYGIGIPIAWFFPAPKRAQWIHRIAIAPLYSIVVAALGARVLGGLGVALDPAQLVVGGLGLWLVAWRVTGSCWQLGTALRSATGATMLVALAGVTWFLSLVGYGLYLPNRDFKNHAYLVAMVSWLRSGEPGAILRASPVDLPSGISSYPIALHTLLGWALPNTSWNSVGVTAAAAVIATSVSLPLAFVALARMWAPIPRGLDWYAGLCAVVLPGLTLHFVYGSVVILVGTSLYAAGLTSLWTWLEQPSRLATIALVVVVYGLFVTHMAEALGLILVGLAAVAPRLRSVTYRKLDVREVVLVGLLAAVIVVLVVASAGQVAQLAKGAEAALTPQRFDALPAFLGVFFHAVSDPLELSLIWIALLVVGVGVALQEHRSKLPIIALGVPVVLHAVATWSAIPIWMRLATAPWFGEGPRIAMLAGPPSVLLAGLAFLSPLMRPRAQLPKPGALVAAGCALVLLVTGFGAVVPQRRADLASTLAGAGDSARLAEYLSAAMAPGTSVMNLEADGSANLFAYARIPVLAAWGYSSRESTGRIDVTRLSKELMRLGSPEVAAAMKELQVSFVVLGTSSVYWGASTGYALELLLQQPQLSLEWSGSDLAVLRYDP